MNTYNTFEQVKDALALIGRREKVLTWDSSFDGLDVDTYFSKRDYDKFIKSLDHVVAANDESGGDNDGNEHYGDENYFNRAA